MGWKSGEQTFIRVGAGDMMNLRLVPSIGSFGSEEAEAMPSRSGPFQSSDGGFLSPVADPAVPINRLSISNPGSSLTPALRARSAIAALGTRTRHLLAFRLADALDLVLVLRLLGSA